MGGDVHPEYNKTTVDLDSDRLIVPEASESPDIDQVMADKPDGITYDDESFGTWEAWTRHLVGNKWVKDNLDEAHFFTGPGGVIDRAGRDSDQAAATDGGTYDPTDEWTDDRPQQDTLLKIIRTALPDRNERISRLDRDTDRRTAQTGRSTPPSQLALRTHRDCTPSGVISYAVASAMSHCRRSNDSSLAS